MPKHINSKKRVKIITFSIFSLILIGLVIYFIFNIKLLLVDGNSMHPTLNDHSLIILKNKNKNSTYKNGDIVVCKINDELVVKRIVASEGDNISYITNQMYINDIYFNDVNSFGMYPTTLIENQFAIIGDNYNYSTDSRIYGYITKDDILGKVISYQNWFTNFYNFIFN